MNREPSAQGSRLTGGLQLWVYSSPFTAAESALAALKAGRALARAWTGSPVLGFVEARAPRRLVLKLPNPLNETRCPRAKAAVISANTVETATSISRVFRPGKSAATSAINSDFLIEKDFRRRSWATDDPDEQNSRLILMTTAATDRRGAAIRGAVTSDGHAKARGDASAEPRPPAGGCHGAGIYHFLNHPIGS